MNKMIFTVASVLTSVLVIACGSDGTDNNVNPNIACPPGTFYQNGYCTGGNGITGGYPGQFSAAIGFYSENYQAKNMQTTSALGTFLGEAMGLCNRGHANGGDANCNNWSNSAFDFVIQAPTTQTNTLQATFRAAMRPNPGFNYSYSLPSAGQIAGAFLGFPVPGNPSAYLPKLQLNMTVSVTNNYQGFEARGYGDYYTKANRSLIQLQVPEGKLENGYFTYRLVYKGQVVATGQLVRCGNADCGVNKPLAY
ncbi:MAG: hypothetical protein IPM97_09720 [Bdellovibrionaceae bacterium]|nr:hypothetical protein [Pseudobdellovibrionaceae bacterium]